MSRVPLCDRPARLVALDDSGYLLVPSLCASSADSKGRLVSIGAAVNGRLYESGNHVLVLTHGAGSVTVFHIDLSWDFWGP